MMAKLCYLNFDSLIIQICTLTVEILDPPQPEYLVFFNEFLKCDFPLNTRCMYDSRDHQATQGSMPCRHASTDLDGFGPT
jgi:hypothetical protein